MYQAANDSKEERCLPAFQPKGKYTEIPLILPLKPEPKEIVTDHSQAVSTAATIIGCAHAYIYILYEKQIYLYVRPITA